MASSKSSAGPRKGKLSRLLNQMSSVSILFQHVWTRRKGTVLTQNGKSDEKDNTPEAAVPGTSRGRTTRCTFQPTAVQYKNGEVNVLEWKWACEACTYHNWSAALKCVICQHPRPESKIVVTNSTATEAYFTNEKFERFIQAQIQQGPDSFYCPHWEACPTFSLPEEICAVLCSEEATQISNAIFDQKVQWKLEEEKTINWNEDLDINLLSRLYALKNRKNGDCLLDAILQATWGICDINSNLRKELEAALQNCYNKFFVRWCEAEHRFATQHEFGFHEGQCARDFKKLVEISGKRGSSLEQLHIFGLAHIIRRPIIVYGVKLVKSLEAGDNLGYARYEGIYLPLFWERSVCSKSPIALGYTRGHFSALVPEKPGCDPLQSQPIPVGENGEETERECIYLPLINHEGALLPIHFLSEFQVGTEDRILDEWLDLEETAEGILVARQVIAPRPPMGEEMMNHWIFQLEG